MHACAPLTLSLCWQEVSVKGPSVRQLTSSATNFHVLLLSSDGCVLWVFWARTEYGTCYLSEQDGRWTHWKPPRRPKAWLLDVDLSNRPHGRAQEGQHKMLSYHHGAGWRQGRDQDRLYGGRSHWEKDGVQGGPEQKAVERLQNADETLRVW